MRELLRERRRVSYAALKRRFELSDEVLEDLKVELIEAEQIAADENGRILVWSVGTAAAVPPSPSPALGRVSHLLTEEKTAIVVPEGGTGDGRGNRKVSALSSGRVSHLLTEEKTADGEHGGVLEES